MSALAEFDKKLEKMIGELTLRILVPRWTEFDAIWDITTRVCDRYELGKVRRAVTEATNTSQPGEVTSSAVPSAVDVPVQTPPPVAA